LDFSERIAGMTAAATFAKTAFVTIVTDMTASAITRGIAGRFALVATATAETHVSAGKFEFRCSVVIECPQ
jgi:hypothetical protein